MTEPHVYEVAPEGTGWVVKRRAEGRTGNVLFNDQQEALQHAVRLARSDRPSQLVVRRQNGTIKETRRYTEASDPGRLVRGREWGRGSLIARLRAAGRRLVRGIIGRAAVANPNHRGWSLTQAAEQARIEEHRSEALRLYGRAVDAYLEAGHFEAAEIICDRLIDLEPDVVRTRCTLAMLAIGRDEEIEARERIVDYMAAVERTRGSWTAVPSLLEMAAATANPRVRRAIGLALRRAGDWDLAEAVERGEAARAEETSMDRALEGTFKRPNEVDVEKLRKG